LTFAPKSLPTGFPAATAMNGRFLINGRFASPHPVATNVTETSRRSSKRVATVGTLDRPDRQGCTKPRLKRVAGEPRREKISLMLSRLKTQRFKMLVTIS
jgi:hypothetical protein